MLQSVHASASFPDSFLPSFPFFYALVSSERETPRFIVHLLAEHKHTSTNNVMLLLAVL